MIDIASFLQVFMQKLDAFFENRVWFVGLQGSYGRGEATESSDIDMVVILDSLTTADIQTYHSMLDTLPHRELLCGFLSGKEEILNWEPADLVQFYHDTTPVRGNLEELLPLLDASALNRAIKTGVCNIYHGCIHNMLYDKSEEILRGLYKSASFVVQAICFLETGNYVKCQADLRQLVSQDERIIVDTFLKLKRGDEVHFAPMSETLFTWSQRWISGKDA